MNAILRLQRPHTVSTIGTSHLLLVSESRCLTTCMAGLSRTRLAKAHENYNRDGSAICAPHHANFAARALHCVCQSLWQLETRHQQSYRTLVAGRISLFPSKSGFCAFTLEQHAQLSQRDRAAGRVSFGQKWKTGTGRHIYKHYRFIFNHCDIIDLQSYSIR